MIFHAASRSLVFGALIFGCIPAGPASAASEVEFTWSRQRPGTEPVSVVVRRGGWAAPHGVALERLSQRPFHKTIMEAARQAGVDPALVHAVIGVESAYNARAVSHKGAMGLMQVIPG